MKIKMTIEVVFMFITHIIKQTKYLYASRIMGNYLQFQDFSGGRVGRMAKITI